MNVKKELKLIAACSQNCIYSMTSHNSSSNHVEAQRMNKVHRIEILDAAQKVCQGSPCH